MEGTHIAHSKAAKAIYPLIPEYSVLSHTPHCVTKASLAKKADRYFYAINTADLSYF